MGTCKCATYKSLSPLTWLLNIFAINSNISQINAASTYFDKIYITRALLTMALLGSINAFTLYYKIEYIYSQLSSSIKLTDLVQMIYDYCQYLVDHFFIYKYGRNISVQYFRRYDYIDQTIGVVYYTCIKWRLVRLIAAFVFIWAVSTGCDYVAWYMGYGWLTPTVFAGSYIYLFIKILTSLDLSSHVMHIELRLRIMGDILQQYYSTTQSLPGFAQDAISNENWLYAEEQYPKSSKLPLRSTPVKVLSFDDSTEIELLTRCYLQLTEQVEFINRMFGYRILLNILSLLIDIVRFTNIAVRIILGTQHTSYNAGYFPAISSLMRQMTCVLVVISLVNHCERTYCQKDRIINTIDHLLINKNPSEKLRAAMTKLRGLVEARPISFNMAKFFRLDNTLLVSLSSVVVTYTIILLQTLN